MGVSVTESLGTLARMLYKNQTLALTSMTYVCPSVALVNCDHKVQYVQLQQKWKSAQDRVGRCLGYLHVDVCDPGCGKAGVLHFSGIKRLTCRVISASAISLVFKTRYSLCYFMVMNWYTLVS